MSPDVARTLPFDIHDESLLRWHFTGIAQKRFEYTRREAEEVFREHHTKIVRFLRNATTRGSQLAAIVLYLEDLN